MSGRLWDRLAITAFLVVLFSLDAPSGLGAVGGMLCSWFDAHPERAS